VTSPSCHRTLSDRSVTSSAAIFVTATNSSTVL
jgi:hypothetical protein